MKLHSQVLTDLRRISVSNLSAVYRATDAVTGQQVALKEAVTESGLARDVISRELGFLLAFEHPDVPRAYDYRVSRAGLPSFTMEWIDGATLKSVAADLSITQLGLVITSLCETLTDLHDRGFVHSDVTPENVLVSMQGANVRAVLMDFGLVSRYGTVLPDRLVGTPGFLAPEVSLGEPLTVAADVFSFGATLEHVCSTRGHIANAPESEVNSSNDLMALAARCQSEDPFTRPRDFAEIMRALRDSTLPVSSQTHIRASSGPWRGEAVGQSKLLRELVSHCDGDGDKGKGLISVQGALGSGKSTLIKKHRQTIQTDGHSTLCARLHGAKEEWRLLMKGIVTWTELLANAAGSSPPHRKFLYLDLQSEFGRGGQPWTRLRSLLREHDITCVLEVHAAGRPLHVPRSTILRVPPLATDQFAELCEIAFENSPWYSGTAQFLYDATGGSPGSLVALWDEVRARSRSGGNESSMTVREPPRALAEQFFRFLESLPRVGQRLACVMSMFCVPVDSRTVSRISGVTEGVCKRWLEALAESGFVMRKVQSGVVYEIRSAWFLTCLVEHAKRHPQLIPSTATSQRVSWELASRKKLTLRSQMSDSSRLSPCAELPAVYRDARFLSEVSALCDEIYSDRSRLFPLSAHVRRSLVNATVASFESVGDVRSASNNARRLIDAEIELLSETGAFDPSAINDLSRTATKYGSFQERRGWFSRMEQLAGQDEDAPMAQLVSERGVVDLNDNDSEAALEKFQLAKSLYNRSHTTDSRSARNLNRIGIVYLNKKRLPQALRYLREAEAQAAHSDDPETKTVIKLNLGVAFTELGETKLALALLRKARDSAAAAHNFDLLCLISRNLTVCLADLEPMSAVYHYAEDTLSASRRSDDRASIPSAYSNLGWVCFRMGRTREAHGHLIDAINGAEPLRDQRALSFAYLNLCRVYRLKWHLDASKRLGIRAYRAAKRFGSVVMKAEALRELAVCALNSGQPDRGLRLLDSAERVAPLDTDRHNRFLTDLVRMELLTAVGDCDSASVIVSSWEDREGGLECPGWECQFKRTKGIWYLAQGDHDDALGQLSKAAALARSLERFDLLISIYEVLLQTHVVARQPQRALPVAKTLKRLYRKADCMNRSAGLDETIHSLEGFSEIRPESEMILKLSEALHRISDKRELLDHLLDIAVGYSGADRGALISEHPVSGAMFIEAESGIAAKSEQLDVIAVSRTVVGDVAKSREHLIVSDATSHPATRDRKSIIELNIQSVICLPIVVQSHFWGVLYLDNRSVPEAFSAVDASLLHALANFMAIGLEQSDEFSRLRLGSGKVVSIEETRGEFLVASESMKSVLNTAERIAASDVSVLILGEHGTGKDVLARYIHDHSDRREKPFVTMNCAGLVESLADTELFGIEANVATNVKFREGKFKLADGGTLFLNEIGDLAPAMQPKLLTALQDRIIERVGGQPMPVNLRFISATNRPLAELLTQGKFREDLFYRINGVTLPVPPLRERPEDITVLAEYFLSHFCQHYSRRKLNLTTRVLDEFMSYHWPGNIRELRGVVERGALLASGDQFPAGLTVDTVDGVHPKRMSTGKLTTVLAETERDIIKRALERFSWNQRKAASHLGLNESSLRTRMKRLGIRRRPAV